MAKQPASLRVIPTAGIMIDSPCLCHNRLDLQPDTEHDVYPTEKVFEHIDAGWLLPFYTLSDADREAMFVTSPPPSRARRPGSRA